MKHLKAILLFVLAGVTLFLFAGCGMDLPSADEIDRSVVLPEQYSITYEVETPEGVVRTVQKTVDANGNVYFASGGVEKLFIKDGNRYALYTRDADGAFTASDASHAYKQSYVDTETSEFMTYAEQSKKQFIPGMESNGEAVILGRACLAYTVRLGGDNTGISYSFYVDQDTGICLGFESDKHLAGSDLGVDGEVFRCMEFVTENVASLDALLAQK